MDLDSGTADSKSELDPGRVSPKHISDRQTGAIAVINVWFVIAKGGGMLGRLSAVFLLGTVFLRSEVAMAVEAGFRRMWHF